MVAIERALHNRKWWLVIAIYLSLLTATGYIAFIAQNYDPAVGQKIDQLASGSLDDDRKRMVINTLREDASGRRSRREMAAHSFTIVLGSIIGFLSASAMSRAARGNEQ